MGSDFGVCSQSPGLTCLHRWTSLTCAVKSSTSSGCIRSFSDLGKAFHDETDVSHCYLSDTEPQAVIEGETGLGDAVIHTFNYRVREAETQVGKCLGRGCKIAQGKVQMRTEQCCPALRRDSCFAESQKLPCPCRPGSWAPREKRHSALHVSKHPFVLTCHWNAAESRGRRWMAGAGRTLSWIIRSSR